jgi:hypothetical protein
MQPIFAVRITPAAIGKHDIGEVAEVGVLDVAESDCFLGLSLGAELDLRYIGACALRPNGLQSDHKSIGKMTDFRFISESKLTLAVDTLELAILKSVDELLLGLDHLKARPACNHLASL